MRIRPRRNRSSEAIREMVRETKVSLTSLMYPLFVFEGNGKSIPIVSMPGISRLSQEDTYREIESSLKLGIKSFVLFPVVKEELKDHVATYSLNEENFYLQTARKIKQLFPEVALMSDVAMDPYSSDGHDGLVESGRILNDETLPILSAMAVLQAEAGFDIIGPSDMMDGRVGAIRDALEDNGFNDTLIMSYCAKYASAFYGPFREALDSAPKFGDKKTYQMDPANKWEALKEAALDEEEGADILMVKPALSYLDVIHVMKENVNLPISAYNVSGEYAMLYAAAQNGWLDKNRAMKEMLLSITRAGADIILTYFAKEYALLLKEEMG
jgi:porphobilinogen synthase